MRHKPKYSNIKLVYVNKDGQETTFLAKDVTSSKQVTNLIGQPIKDSGSRFITDADIDFEIDAYVMLANTTIKKRITSVPEMKMKGNNLRRGYYRSDKVIVTT